MVYLQIILFPCQIRPSLICTNYQQFITNLSTIYQQSCIEKKEMALTAKEVRQQIREGTFASTLTTGLAPGKFTLLN